jgi:ribosomal protein S18 acetylase RimI-like enzyme
MEGAFGGRGTARINVRDTQISGQALDASTNSAIICFRSFFATDGKSMSGTVEIRAIGDADVEAVIALWHAAGVARPWNDPVVDIAFARRGPHSTILVAVVGGAIAATVMVGEDGHRGWVYYVAADPEQQGSGLGRAIMTAAEDWLKTRGVWKLQLMVRGDNAAVQEFYKRLGYKLVDTVCFQKVIG